MPKFVARCSGVCDAGVSLTSKPRWMEMVMARSQRFKLNFNTETLKRVCLYSYLAQYSTQSTLILRMNSWRMRWRASSFTTCSLRNNKVSPQRRTNNYKVRQLRNAAKKASKDIYWNIVNQFNKLSRIIDNEYMFNNRVLVLLHNNDDCLWGRQPFPNLSFCLHSADFSP